jgi:hypothetical protein
MKTACHGPRRTIPVLLLALALAAPLAAQSDSAKGKSKDKKADTTTFLLIHIVGGEKPAPVANANVYMRFQEKSAILFLLKRDKKVELDLKTDNDGFASFPEVPQGKVLIQVVAQGWQTFGEYYMVNKPKQTIHIKLDRPKTHWY